MVACLLCVAVWYQVSRVAARERAMGFLKTQGHVLSIEECRTLGIAWLDTPYLTSPRPWYHPMYRWYRYCTDDYGESMAFVHMTITDEIVDAMAMFPKTRSLHLQDSTVTDKQLLRLAGLRNLSYLNLERTPVTDAGLECLLHSQELQWLELNDTAITDKSVPYILQLKTLKVLRIHNTRITNTGAKQLTALPKLEQLSLFTRSGTPDPITKETYDYIESHLKGCDLVGGYAPKD